MKLYDVVFAIRKLSPKVPKGSKGTVLMIYSPTDLEVEFVDTDGATLDVVTVSRIDIEKYQPDESASSK